MQNVWNTHTHAHTHTLDDALVHEMFPWLHPFPLSLRVETPRKQGGLGDMKIPLLSDKTGEIARAYGVYKDSDGVAFR